MKIFLAICGGGTGFPEPFRRIKEMKLYLAGGESRHWLNLPLIEDNKNETVFSGRNNGRNFWKEDKYCLLDGGDMGSLNEIIPCRRILQEHGQRSQADCMGGGFPNEVKNENIHSRHSSMWGGKAEYYSNAIKQHKPYILESFYYADETTEKLIPYFGDFLLDSGAFTFMQASKSHVKWEEYIERYAGFINRNNIQKYFELDIDSVVGYDKVLEYRKRLEKLTNKPVIPVWHKSRGIDSFKSMCDEYSYVAIGGIVSKEIKPEQYIAFPQMISEAHKRKAKIHGLGFTSLEWLPKCHFDSVDSTAWTTGNRFGFVYQFNGKTMIKHDVPKGKRLADSRKVALINYTEWIKFQKYAERNL